MTIPQAIVLGFLFLHVGLVSAEGCSTSHSEGLYVSWMLRLYSTLAGVGLWFYWLLG